MDFNKHFNDLPSDLITPNEVDASKLVKLYAYNAYFDGDEEKTDEVMKGFCYKRDTKNNIDGVYVDNNEDDEPIECLYSYFIKEEPFDLYDVKQAINMMASLIQETLKRHFKGINEKAERLITDYFADREENKQKTVFNIRVLTNYDPDDYKKREIEKELDNLQFSSPRGAEIRIVISFASDIVQVIDSNKAPFDYVLEGSIEIDDCKNILHYADNSFVCNIKASSLRELWKKEGTRGLLAMNLRYYIKSKNIDSQIENSVNNNYQNFWYLNNGIIIVCSGYTLKDNTIRLKEFSIVNGGQTTRLIGSIPFEHDFFLTCKIIKNTCENNSEKNAFIASVAEASNSQKPIKIKDIIANRVEQRNLKSDMQTEAIFVEVKRGDKPNKEIFKEPWQRSKNNEIAQDLYSFVYLKPGPARTSVSAILQSKDKYDLIFQKHSYSTKFLKSLLFLEKAYREYAKAISKENLIGEDGAIKKGLCSNGLHYTLATIGYMLKLIYNNEYKNDMYRYRNNSAYYSLYSIELAFNHAFIKENQTFKEFKQSSINLFDYIFTNFLIPRFKVDKSNNPSIAYSNWLKTNTGFEGVIRDINASIFDAKQEQHLQAISKYFVSINTEQMNKNIDDYEDLIKKNAKIISKNSKGQELNAIDEDLRNKLMIYRLNYSLAKHISERNVFTDKMLDRMVSEKPMNKEALLKIINPSTFSCCGEELLKIITEFI